MFPPEILLFPFFRQTDGLLRRFLRFLLKRVGKYHQLCSIEKPKETENIRSGFYTDFPQVVRIDHLLEILSGHTVQIFHKAHNPGRFLRLFGRERFEKIPNRASSALRFVKEDFAYHVQKLTCRLTTVKPGNPVIHSGLWNFPILGKPRTVGAVTGTAAVVRADTHFKAGG
ncbi:MAG: hypothetical protein WC701_08565 [Kiritimatiellales bacterium]